MSYTTNDNKMIDKIINQKKIIEIMKGLYESNSYESQKSDPELMNKNSDFIDENVIFDDIFANIQGKKLFYKNFSILHNMERIQELYGFILSSKRREEVLKTLRKKPLRPFEIADKTKYKAPNVSKTLFQL